MGSLITAAARAQFRDEFDDCVVGSQFDIYCLHHPVLTNRVIFRQV